MPGEVSRSYEGPTDAKRQPPQHNTINTSAIRAICLEGNKDYAILVAVDRGHGTTQFVTWGRSPEDKVEASELSDRLSAELCGPQPPIIVYESYKLDAARNKAMVESLVDILEFFLVATDPLLDATSFDAYDPVAHHAVAKRARETVAAIRAAGAGVTKTGWSAELPAKPGWYFRRYTRPGFDRAIVFCEQVITGPDGATLHVCDGRDGPTPLDRYTAYEWAAVSPPP